jgi:hypothetical protein
MSYARLGVDYTADSARRRGLLLWGSDVEWRRM